MSPISKITSSIFFLLILTVSILAQNKDIIKYLAGAVPEIDGKVVFSDTIYTKHQANEIVQIVEQWAEAQKETKDKYYDSKVIYNDASKHELVLLINDRFIFSSSALSLDYTLITYYLVVEAQNDLCQLTIKSIKYKYTEDKDVLTADDMISDEAALNKEKTKIYRKHNKFRIATVDMVNNTFDELEKYLNKGEYDAIKNASKGKKESNTVTTNTDATPQNTTTVVEEASIKPTSENTASTQIQPTTTNQLVLDTKSTISDLSKQKIFALNNFFIVGEGIAYVRQVSALSVDEIEDKASIVCYIDNDGTMLQQAQIMPSSKFKILYYTPNYGSYAQLAELSRKYATGEPYTEADISMIEILLENSQNTFQINHLKIETLPTNNVTNNPTISNMPTVGKFIKTDKTVVITGEVIGGYK